ncbi:MAG: hypothetical protein ABJC26_10785 [Gemmatimonadaceae bacterium]
MRFRLTVASCFAVIGLSAPQNLRGQTGRIDAGSFTILKSGQRVGREQFSLSKAPSPEGAAFELRAESNVDERRTAVQLSTDSVGTPVKYAVEIREGTTVSARLGGQRVRGRFATQARRPRGESAREYLLAPGTLVIESDFFHQLCFVIRGRALTAGESLTLPVISPLENAQREMKVTLESLDDSVTIAGNKRPARRWRLEEKGGLLRTVWGDAQGRILRVLVPSLFLEAVRDDIPR